MCPNKITLSEEFFDGEKVAIEVTVKILYNGQKGDIINQYITFTKILYFWKTIKIRVVDSDEPDFLFVRHGRALVGASPEHARVVGNTSLSQYSESVMRMIKGSEYGSKIVENSQDTVQLML